MSETYEIYTPNGLALDVEKDTNKILFKENVKPTGNYTEEYSKALFEAHDIKRNSPYKDYKPQYLDPNFYTGQSSTLLEFKEWQSIYLKDPIKGAIAPWTKAEKAYYKSLKTKRERYKYLAIRSGLRSVVIDIPYDAYANVDEKGYLINEEYAYIYDEVSSHRGTLKSYSFFNEWELSALLLGNIKASPTAAVGFKARQQQALFLQAQLGDKNAFKSLGLAVLCSNSFLTGQHWNKLRAKMIYDLHDYHYESLLDEFGMIPFLDEIIGVDWVIDLNRYKFALDEEGRIIWALYDDIEKGKLKDPRDIDSTYESRREFDRYRGGYKNGMRQGYETDTPNDWSEEEAQLFNDTLILHAKLAALTPPQGYPNAPYYFTPENLEWYYKRHKLDRLLDPRIPAIYRYNFPQELRAKIRAYAKEHNIKE
ncbi:hypothetical protein JHQ96_04055 [Campylobacter jejuni]|uniref:hypothetical protein n=1 Tax=Campylobacter jejuni TaxID=197 RepID=UPI001AD6CE01|nr:hypothetical protein [Campylobacter jejuni]MBO7059208.1 hypothetical protein [Campylobacter jejuni]MCC9472559.1 hypothetical protein [Campylobacter jejuni]MCC9477880.1 hypothetical protein [Campylobacter jejuni]MCC9486814.1 hypothetical protein [Campylobacter jejuni]